MSVAMTINLVTIFLCLAVLVQSLRMMRALQAVRAPDFAAMIAGLDQAAGQAGLVLAGLRSVLAGDVAVAATKLETAAALRDELTMLIDLAEARAERLVAASAPPAGACAEPRPRYAGRP